MPDDGSNILAGIAELRGALSTIVGDANMRDDPATLELFSQDIWSAGAETAALAVSPMSIDEVSRVVAAANAAGFLNSVLGPAGERWAPHGLAPLSQAPALFEAIEGVFADMADAFAREFVSTGYLFTHLSTNALIIEPVFYWPEARLAVHAPALEPAHLAKLSVQPDNPTATAVVIEARKRVLEIFTRFGCGHFQIDRTYPYRQSRDSASWSLIEAVKAEVDPTGALNPGGLGLTGGEFG